MGCNQGEISILFTDDDYITELNRQYLNRSKSTNVLAFPMVDDSPMDIQTGMLGDVVISLDTAKREAADMEEPFLDTVYRLLVHGILHLLGYDHERSSGDEEIMTKEQERLFALIREE
ncbi:MAG: rRNA maturation RNase YbeY [Deltaproteobacteria bacterium]|nr:rRNA maturation RNase YbeY [Deltaproteobacteria bacterium]